MGRKLALIIIGVIVLLALAGGGVAAYLLVFAKKPVAETTEEAPPPAPIKRPAFIPLDPFSVWVQPEGQKVREVIVIFHLEAPPDNVPEINSKMHLLRDRYIRELMKLDPIKVPVRFETKDLAELRNLLRQPTEEVMGKGLVTQVLLLNILSPLK
ncbi:hypothetical protein [Ferrovibrio sp.]|uniref:flagellar basal body-associated FliL family protein n=1 Tax=Ferrovibrio sp. TaxID=1917215 RepID=UPI001B5B3E85|nr:hypothetical protein [Ferrovibrio sp.]MBP7066184.1 hypothetical protein [Ferrovibrio sp.]